MDADHFDAMTRALAAPVGRRRLLRALLGGCTAGLLGRRRARAALDYETFVSQASRVIAGKMGLAPLTTAVLVAEPGQKLCSGQTTVACADAVDARAERSGPVTHCNVLVDAQAQTFGDRDLAEILAHEVFHCYQPAAVGFAHFNARPWGSWVEEGQAPWAAKMVVQELGYSAVSTSSGSWRDYLLTPEKPLLSRVYDAIGFYAQLAQSGVDPWQRFIPMLRTSNPLDAYHAAADPGGTAFLDKWAAGYFREPTLGPDWDITGPPPASGAFKAQVLPIVAGSGETSRIDIKPFTVGLFRIGAGADVVKFAIVGHARIADGQGTDAVALQDAYFCTRTDGCTCPPKTKPRTELPQQPLRLPASLAVTGGPDGAIGSVSGLSLDDFCEPDDGICEAGGTCNNTLPCASGCGCMTTTEGTGACVPNPLCKDVPPCLASTNCPPGFACITLNCCEDGLPRCAPICTTGSVSFTPDSISASAARLATFAAGPPS